jgi:hypothetical protein
MITTRTRKLLWSSAAGRCAICKIRLSAEATTTDPEAVLGEEAHIISGAGRGPRAGEIETEKVDDLANLVLLCRNHHREVDAQPGAWPSKRLRRLKDDHEQWVEKRLAPQQSGPWRVRDENPGQPLRLERCEHGAVLWDLAVWSHAWHFANPDPSDEAEAELFGGLFDELKDWGDIYDVVSTTDALQVQVALTQRLREMRERGFVVYVGRRPQILVAGDEGSPWHAAVVRIVATRDVLVPQ